jgi:hypothetical protein
MINYMHYAVMFLCLVLLIFLLLAEARRLNRANLVWRILANVVAVTSLVLLIVPVSYKVQTFKANTLNVFTAGTDLESVPKAFKKGYALQSIPDLSYFLKGKPEIDRINLFGYGLKSSDLQKIAKYQFHFYPTEPKGITSVRWNRRVSYTKKLQLQGTYVNPASKGVRLILRGFGSNLDSALIPANKTFKFSLTCIPKQSGKATFELLAFSGEKLIAGEKIPIEVDEVKPLNVLLMASNPDFEYKFLKNWLFKEGHAVMLRSRISKNALSVDFLNMKALDLNAITGTLLKKVDVLICDETEFASLSSRESKQVEQAVSKGMGLLVRVSDLIPPSGANLSRQFLRYEVPGLSEKVEQKLFLKTSSTSLQFSKDKSGRILAERTLHGRGKVAGSVLLDTYKMLLQGNSSRYHSYWSEVIGDLSRVKANNTQFEIFPQIPLVGERIRIVVRQVGTDVPTIKLNGRLLPPRQSLTQPMEWDVVAFPAEYGWNKLDINGDQASFFVHDKSAWVDSKNNNTSIATAIASRLSNLETASPEIHGETLNKRVPIWVFFISFLLSVGFLWLEPKLLLQNLQ